jgi:hypothetical protein
MLKPSVHEMLTIADGCGLTHIEEAYFNYTRHYDLFFDIKNYNDQYVNLVQELKKYGFVNKDMTLKDISVKEGLERVEARSSSGKSS